MKTIFFSKLILPLLLLGPAVSHLALGQSDPKEKSEKDQKTNIRIRITEDENGKVKKIERSYQLGAMTAEEKDAFVEKVLDSLGRDKRKKQTISIDMNDGDQDVMAIKKRRKEIIDHRDEREPLAYHWKNDLPFDFDSERFHTQMRDFGRDFKPRAKVLMKDMENFGDRMGDIFEKEMGKPANVRALNVYSNNPDNGIINLRFSVPEKGDVTISVTDTKGKEVGKKEIKDFEGEFVGQVELKKQTKGTLFVTVVQNEDGAVKRIVIP